MQVPLVLRKLFRRRIVLAAAVGLTAMLLVALFAGQITGFDPNETAVSQRLAKPLGEHVLGVLATLGINAGSTGFAINSLIHTVRKPPAAGSAAPGDPPDNSLAAHALGSASP